MCETKTCTKCGEVKPLTEFYKHKRDGTHSRCKACHLAARKEWRAANLEKEQETGRAWRAANPEKRREAERARRAANPEKHREDLKAWRAANPEKARESSRAWRAANQEKHRESVRAWQAKNPEKAREMRRVASAAARYRLSDSYIRTNNLGFPVSADVPQALIELKRAQIQLHRAIYERNTST